MYRSSLNLALILIIHTNFPSISCTTNDTKESILEKPPIPATGTSRLPTSLQNFVINSTNLQEEATIVEKKISENVKEVREPPEFEEPPRKPIQVQTNTSYEPFAKPSNENYITIGNHKLVKSTGENYETGFTPFVPSPLHSEEIISTPYYSEEGAAFKSNNFKSSAEVKHEHFYSPSLSSYYGGNTHNNLINLPYSKFHHEKVPQVTTYAPPKVNPMQRPNLYYDKKYPAYVHPTHHHFDDFGKTNDFTSPDFHHDKFPADFHAHNDFLANGAPQVDDGFFHNYPKPVFSGKPYHKGHGLWQILATLLPIGLFLSALQPKVIFINSTNPQPPLPPVKPFFRYADENAPSTDANVVLYNLVANAGLLPSSEITCNKMKICQTALAGSESNDDSNFAEYSLWYLISRSTTSIRKKLHLDDVFEAVQSRQCEQFSCPVQQETTAQKNQT